MWTVDDMIWISKQKYSESTIDQQSVMDGWMDGWDVCYGDQLINIIGPGEWSRSTWTGLAWTGLACMHVYSSWPVGHTLQSSSSPASAESDDRERERDGSIDRCCTRVWERNNSRERVTIAKEIRSQTDTQRQKKEMEIYIYIVYIIMIWCRERKRTMHPSIS